MHANRNHYQSDVQFNTEGNSLMLIVNALIENQRRIGKVSHRECVPGLFVHECVCVCLEGRPKKRGGKKCKVMNLRDCRKFHICYLRWHSCTFLWTL